MDKAKKKRLFVSRRKTKKKENSSLHSVESLFSFLSRAEFHNNNHSLTTQDALVKKITETDDDANRETRAEGRGLWDVIVNNDDICFQHILPRLNGTDLKFLYEVNTETRKLIERSSRAGDLRKRFNVEEMSSISTLEVAWKHYPWGTVGKDGLRMYETDFCIRVAETNKLELLKWAREEKKCKWDYRTINVAARQGNMEMVKYCVANECPTGTETCACAAENGHLEVLKYLREEAKTPWDYPTSALAAYQGHLHILEYLVERKFEKYDACACMLAARNGHLECLKYLHETAEAPWDSHAVRKAHENNQPEYVQYLLDNDCPLPYRWTYEHGDLTVIEPGSESSSESSSLS